MSSNYFPNSYQKYWKKPDLCFGAKRDYFDLKKNPLIDDRHIVSKVCKKYNIKKKAFRYWIHKWETNISWSPCDTKNRGTAHRIFKDDEEDSIMQYIDDNYISQGNFFSDKEFQTLAFDAFDQIHNGDENVKNFSCSAHFIHDFKERHNVSSRLGHFKQRANNSKKNDNDDDFLIETFKVQIQSLIEAANQKGEPVINGDETGFQILPNCVKTWAYKNSKNIAINVQDSTKSRISVMASITSSNEKLPLFIIAGANSNDEKEELLGELIDPNVSSYSSKSYMTTDNFIEYLQFIRNQYNPNITIHLIIDSYSSHKSIKSVLKAKELNIDLIFIPSGLTDILQPLDVAIFAPLKSIVNSKIRRYLFGNQKSEVGMKRTVKFIQEAYKELSIDNLLNAWDQYF